MIFGIAGQKGVGKDTAAAVLIEAGFTPLKFADVLKNMLRTLLQMQGVDSETIERMIEGDLKEEPHWALSDQSPRHAMQTLGTQWGRDCMGDQFWIEMAIRRASQSGNVVFTDVRFPNEVDAIHAEGGRVVRITRPDLPAADMHESERYIPTLEVDVDVVNAAPSAAAFQAFVSREWMGW